MRAMIFIWCLLPLIAGTMLFRQSGFSNRDWAGAFRIYAEYMRSEPDFITMQKGGLIEISDWRTDPPDLLDTGKIQTAFAGVLPSYRGAQGFNTDLQREKRRLSFRAFLIRNGLFQVSLQVILLEKGTEPFYSGPLLSLQLIPPLLQILIFPAILIWLAVLVKLLTECGSLFRADAVTEKGGRIGVEPGNYLHTELAFEGCREPVTNSEPVGFSSSRPLITPAFILAEKENPAEKNFSEQQNPFAELIEFLISLLCLNRDLHNGSSNEIARSQLLKERGGIDDFFRRAQFYAGYGVNQPVDNFSFSFCFPEHDESLRAFCSNEFSGSNDFSGGNELSVNLKDLLSAVIINSKDRQTAQKKLVEYIAADWRLSFSELCRTICADIKPAVGLKLTSIDHNPSLTLLPPVSLSFPDGERRQNIAALFFRLILLWRQISFDNAAGRDFIELGYDSIKTGVGTGTEACEAPCLWLKSAGCWEDSGADIEADTGADIDADIEADTGADIDADTGADIEADIDADTGDKSLPPMMQAVNRGDINTLVSLKGRSTGFPELLTLIAEYNKLRQENDALRGFYPFVELQLFNHRRERPLFESRLTFNCVACQQKESGNIPEILVVDDDIEIKYRQNQRLNDFFLRLEKLGKLTVVKDFQSLQIIMADSRKQFDFVLLDRNFPLFAGGEPIELSPEKIAGIQKRFGIERCYLVSIDLDDMDELFAADHLILFPKNLPFICQES